MHNQQLIERMRSRVAQLRRMAEMSHDERIVDVLADLVAEIEADIARLEAEAPSRNAQHG